MSALPRLLLPVSLALGLCAGAAVAQTAEPGSPLPEAAAPPASAEAAPPEEAVPETPEAELAYARASGVVFATVQAEAPAKVNTSDHLSCDSKMATLLDTPAAREVLQRRIPDVVSDPRIVLARGMTLKQLAKHRQTGITPEVMAEIDQDLAATHHR